MAETVTAKRAAVGGEVVAIGILEALPDDDEDSAQALEHVLAICDELLQRKCHLGQVDQMGGVFLGSLGQSRRGGDPAGIATHYLQDGAGVGGVKGFGVAAGVHG